MRIFYIIGFILISSIVLGQEDKSINLQNRSYQYALIEASRQKMVGNINEAIVLYNECIKAKPDCDVAYYELGTIFSALNDNKKAETFLKKAYELDPDNYWYGYAYSELLKINKKSEKSIEILKKIRKTNSENELTINYKIAEIYSEMGKYNKALKILNQIEKNWGLSEMVSFMKSETYKRQGDIKSAEKELIKLVESVPDFSGYRLILAEHYIEVNDTVKAIEAYENAFKIDSSDVTVITKLYEIYLKQKNYHKALYYLNAAFGLDNINIINKIQVLIMLTRDKLFLQHEKDGVKKLVIELLNKYPENIDVKTVAYDFYNGIGDSIIAFTLIRQILEQKKDVYIIWQQALYNANMLGDYDEMILIGEEALKYFPNKAEIFLMIGMAYFQKQDFDKSYKMLMEGYSFVTEVDQIKLQYLIFLAESSYKTDRKIKAFEFYEELINLNPGDIIVKNNYSYFLALEGKDLEKAKKLSSETLEKEPENSTYLDTYAWILFRMENYQEARKYIEKALQFTNDKDPDVLFHYAEILFKTGDKELSRKYYKEAEMSGFNKDIILQKLQNLDCNE